jgi:hypothetical protein
MPYSFGHFLLAVRLLLQGWSEKYDRTKDCFASMIVSRYREKALRWRFSAPSAGLDLASNQGNCHTFARPITASGDLREIVCRE